MMLLKSEWAERFLDACSRVKSARRRTLAPGTLAYTAVPDGDCWAVASGYVKVLDPRFDGGRAIRLIMGHGGLFGDRPFEAVAFRGFSVLQPEQAIAHGPAAVIALDRSELETASRADSELASLMLESTTARAQFLERRLLWQLTTPIRARVAATLRDLICFEGQRCKHGHTIDVRLSHQDISELGPPKKGTFYIFGNVECPLYLSVKAP